MSASLNVLVPRFADADNLNPQNQNAKSLLKRFHTPGLRWSMVYFQTPLTEIAQSRHVELARIPRNHLWRPSLVRWYQKAADAVFYPGPLWADNWGLRLRQMGGRRIPVIATLEGLIGNPEREHRLSVWAGHAVFCQPVSSSVLRRADYIFRNADHIIAISPFLADMGRKLYGEKVSAHMLGVEKEIFHSTARAVRPRPLVVNIAGVRAHKRPAIFLELAARFPAADFVWFGEGNLRAELTAEASRRNLKNLSFPGARSSQELAESLRSAYLFAMPSLAEGVPKVTQEAASCGLPLVIFGHYQAPTVAHGENGFVVWTDSQFFERVGELLVDSKLAAAMGEQSRRLSENWNWNVLAPAWEQEILSKI